MAATQNNMGPRPSDAPDKQYLASISYNGSPLTITQLPWPAGIVFPMDSEKSSITISASSSGKWGGDIVSVAPNELAVYFNSNPVATTVTQGDLDPAVGAIDTPSTLVPTSSTLTPTSTTSAQPSSATGDLNTAPQSPFSSASNVTSTGASAQTSTPSKESNGGGLSSGAVAGVAIGCLLAGALIAGLTLWFCCGKRRTTHTRDSEASARALMSQEKGPTIKSIPLGSVGHRTSPLASGLPQPLEDGAISGEISKISSSIKNHVQSYYHTGRVNSVLIDSDDAQALGHGLPVSVGTLSTLLGNPTTREVALRFCIAWAVVYRMQPRKLLAQSFLPFHAGQCLEEITHALPGSKSHALLTARWRAITAELLQSTYTRNAFGPTDSRNSSIQATLEVLENILLPFTDSRMDNGQRRRNLEEILKRSASFAFTLFSQPSSWRFDWKEHGNGSSGGLCIFPALMQATDETGEQVSPPRPFSEAVVRRLDD